MEPRPALQGEGSSVYSNIAPVPEMVKAPVEELKLNERLLPHFPDEGIVVCAKDTAHIICDMAKNKTMRDLFIGFYFILFIF